MAARATREYRYPRVLPLERPRDVAPTPVPEPHARPCPPQRALVEASLLRCPPPAARSSARV